MGIEDKQTMSKPRWRYHWGNHVPEGLVEWQTQVMFREWVMGVYFHNLDRHFRHEPIDPENHIIAYRIK